MKDDILITGGLGFMGFHLCKHLIDTEPNRRIVIVDPIYSTKLPVKELEYLNKFCDVFVQDFRDFSGESYSFSEIYHLASPVGSLGVLKLNGKLVEEIVQLTQHAIDLAIKNHARLLYISSSEVYGKDGTHIENADLIVAKQIGSRIEYSLGKLSSEVILRNRAIKENFVFNIVRPFNVIGAFQSALIGFVVPAFFEAATTGNNIPVFVPGTQRRSFCDVDDLVRGLCDVQKSLVSNEVFNIGNPNNLISIGELATKIKSICNSSSKIDVIDPQEIYGKIYVEAFEKKPEVSKASKLLGWEPKISLDDALDKIYKYYLTE